MYIGEAPKFQNFFVMGQSKRFIEKRNSELGMHPQLIILITLWYIMMKVQG